MANPFQAAEWGQRSVPSSPVQPPQPMAAALSAASPAGPSSPMISAPSMPAGRPYSPLTDPEGPLARAGWIGALLAQGPSRTEHLQSIEDQKAKDIGQARGQAFQTLAGLVQTQGLSPQKAFLQFMNTPDGMNFIVKDPDPTAALSQFMKMAQGDPAAQARAGIFGGLTSTATTPGVPQPSGAGGPAAQAAQAATQQAASAPPAAPQQGPTLSGAPMAVPVAPAVQPQVAQTPQIQVSVEGKDYSLPADVDGEKLREAAKRLAAAGLTDDAKVALDMAKQYDDKAKAQRENDNAQLTPDIKEYRLNEQQRKAAGLPPQRLEEYQLAQKNASSIKVNTAEGKQALITKAKIDLDSVPAKAAAEAALKAQQVMPALDEVERLAQTTSGGIKGALLPSLGKVATLFNIAIPPEWSDAEALSALTMQLVPLVRQPGAVSDYEQKTYSQAVPSLSQTPQGRLKILNIMKRQAARAQEIAKTYRDNLGADDLYDKLAALDKPMFTAAEMEEFKAAPQVAPPPAGSPAPASTKTIAPGTIEGGYKFRGGDPHKKSNWVIAPSEGSNGGGGF